MLEWLEDKVAALEAEEDGSAPLSFCLLYTSWSCAN